MTAAATSQRPLLRRVSGDFCGERGLGLSALGGVVGARCAPALTNRLGFRGTLLTFGVARTLWLGLIPFAEPGIAGLALIVVADTALLFCAGVFNPTFITYRIRETQDAYMARVVAAWSISSKVIQPLFILAGGLLAAATSTRFAIGAAAVLLLASTALLPWTDTDDDPATPAHTEPVPVA